MQRAARGCRPGGPRWGSQGIARWWATAMATPCSLSAGPSPGGLGTGPPAAWSGEGPSPPGSRLSRGRAAGKRGGPATGAIALGARPGTTPGVISRAPRQSPAPGARARLAGLAAACASPPAIDGGRRAPAGRAPGVNSVTVGLTAHAADGLELVRGRWHAGGEAEERCQTGLLGRAPGWRVRETQARRPEGGSWGGTALILVLHLARPRSCVPECDPGPWLPPLLADVPLPRPPRRAVPLGPELPPVL